ncbi:hypothetical protein J5I95_18515 [Candidatus Poribacteria bacterium]|nr:hypothetical protein [Candidatus Poribacteria bacterium]
MLSKKMAVSLMSLITILALASMPVFAFDVKFDAHDISYASDIQIERAEVIEVYVNFGKVVTLEDVKSKFSGDAVSVDGAVDILNYHGAVIDVEENVIAVVNREVDVRLTEERNRIQAGKDFTIKITIPPGQLPGEDVLDKNDHAYRIRLYLPKGAITEADRKADAKSNEGFHDKIFLVHDEPEEIDKRGPKPVSIKLASGTLVPDAGFNGDTFNIIITLTEQPKENKLTAADHFDVAEGTAADAVYLGPMSMGDTGEAQVTFTGRSRMHQQYLVTVTPAAKDATLVFKLKTFGDQEIYTYDETLGKEIVSLGPNMWKPDPSDLDRMEGVDKITVKINKKPADPVKTAGLMVELAKDKVIPSGGYLVVVNKEAGAGVDKPGGDQDKSPKPTERTPAQLLYNLIEQGGLPNLETFLANGGTIDLVAPDAGVVISEIMWGSDASLDNSYESQWIEIQNTSGKELKTGDKTYKLVFYGAGETLPDMTDTDENIQDRVSTIGASGLWSIAGKGQSGRTGVGEAPDDDVAVTPTQALISMQRMAADADGTMASSWEASSPPGLNFKTNIEGIRVGSPGAAPITYPGTPETETETETETDSPPDVAMADDIKITEIMVDTGNNRLPQWIELTNMSGAEKSLDDWSVEISNDSADADVVGAKVSIKLMGTIGVHPTSGIGQTVLLVAWDGRSSSNLSKLGDRLMDVSDQLHQKGRYTLLSPMGFMIELLPPQNTGVVQFGDSAGNLGASPAWDIPMDDSGRSSLIRHAMLADGTATMGTDANGWVLASSTGLVDTPATWYGSDEDAGTPGVVGGGPLPVALSHFRPARDKATGAVVITWATQSELNNAGFFIKRSNQRDGEFQVINATMVPGAGTTSEKQFYTYTDTTAQPNIVYYYQIEDVSLDGNRQTLTRGIRLKGHIGAAGKLTSTWGEIKANNE